MGLSKDSKIKMTSVFKRGENNLITDVPGVKVGHCTLKDAEKDIHTGVTAIFPHEGNLFKDKVLAATSVINGFGKSAGLVQIDELGTIETPILMTNTLSVGAAVDALIKYMLKDNEDIGVSTGTVNCVVTECNDGELNDIRGQHVKQEHVYQALENADVIFDEGDVGAGSGMICMGLKGGIGSASRIVNIDDIDYTVGAMVLSNFGFPGLLRIDGKPVDVSSITERKEDGVEKGSVIILVATDIPLSERQLRRVAKRATVGLARVGSYLGNGSGDIAIAFTTANRMPHYGDSSVVDIKMINDRVIDKVFQATAEAVEESVYSSLDHAHTVTGIRGKKVYALSEVL